MNKFTVMWISVALLLATGAAPVSAAAPGFGQVVDGVDGKKNTKLAAKENWKKWKGTEVSWAGTVHEVDSKGDKAKVYVADKSRPLYKGYNITLITPMDKAANLKRGQAIRFKGLLDGYDTKDSGAVIGLKDVQLQ